MLGDNKEGVLGMRVARALEQPSKTADVVPRRQRQAGGERPSTTRASPATTSAATARPATRSGARAGRGRCCRGRSATRRSPSPCSTIPTIPASRPTGMRAATGCSPPTISARRRSIRSRRKRKRTIPAGGSMTFRHRVLIVDGTPDAAQMTAEQQEVRGAEVADPTRHERSASSAAETSATRTRVRRRRFPASRVVACYGGNRERTAKLAAQHGAAVYDDLDRFLDHRPMDIVAIGSPSGAARASRASPRPGAACTCCPRSRSTSPPSAPTR